MVTVSQTRIKTAELKSLDSFHLTIRFYMVRFRVWVWQTTYTVCVGSAVQAVFVDKTCVFFEYQSIL